MYEQLRNKINQMIEEFEGLVTTELDEETCQDDFYRGHIEALRAVKSMLPPEPNFDNCVIEVSILTLDRVKDRMKNKHGLDLTDEQAKIILEVVRREIHDQDMHNAFNNACWVYISLYHNQDRASINRICKQAMYQSNDPLDHTFLPELQRTVYQLHEQGRVITLEYAKSVLSDIKRDKQRQNELNEKIVKMGWEPFPIDSLQMTQLENLLYWKQQQFGGEQDTYLAYVISYIKNSGFSAAYNEIVKEYLEWKKSITNDT